MSKTRKQRGRGHGRPGSSKHRMNVVRKGHHKTHRHYRKHAYVSPRTMYALRATVPANQRSTLEAFKHASPRTKALREREKQENAAKAAKAQQEKSYMISMARKSAKNKRAANAVKAAEKRQAALNAQRVGREERAARFAEIRAMAHAGMVQYRKRKNALGLHGMEAALEDAMQHEQYEEVIRMLSGLGVHNHGPAAASAAASAAPARRERSMADVLAGHNSNDD
jgi:hypothetical protein